MFISKKDSPAWTKTLSILNQPITYLFFCFILVLAVGTFTKLGYNSDRFGRDLASFISISTAVFLGTALTYYKEKIRYLALAVIVLIIMFNHHPIEEWTSDYSALRPCDIEAIDYLNSFSGENINVQVTATVANKIYKLYTEEEVNYTRVYTLELYTEADYIVFRNNDMTWGTANRVPDDFQPINQSELDNMPSLVKVAQFESNGDKVAIYHVVQ
jgi:hypothetical protein